MKKTYTRKQITEAIAYWKKQLKKMNESMEDGIDFENVANQIKGDEDYYLNKIFNRKPLPDTLIGMDKNEKENFYEYVLGLFQNNKFGDLTLEIVEDYECEDGDEFEEALRGKLSEYYTSFVEATDDQRDEDGAWLGSYDRDDDYDEYDD